MTKLNIKEKTQHFVPYLLALTMLYTIVYHILMFNILQKDVTEDECNDAAYSGGIFPPQCFEIEVFRDWHKREAEELLTVVGGDSGEDARSDATLAGRIAMIVDENGNTFADKITQDLAGLETTFNQLRASSLHLDSNLDRKDETTPAIEPNEVSVDYHLPSRDGKPAPLTSSATNLEVVQEQVHQTLHAELNELDAIQSKTTNNRHNGQMSFESFQADLEARHKKRAENRARLVQEAAQRMDKLDKNLLDVVSDKKAWESTLRQKYDTTASTENSHHPSTSPKIAFMSKRLQWSITSAVQHQRKDSEFLKADKKETVVVSKNDVRHMHWTGKLPKVAAVASIKGDQKHRARMMYFVDNFNLQNYEGEKELVLLYHYKDSVAAQLISRYANDTSVKGVAAHDKSQELFPSDPAFRYAAWSSDADVIAHWDADEYHDPDRLRLQVRAMAYSNRPACVLSTSSASHSQEEEETKEIHHVSLIGERAWMKAHWHPISREESEVMDAFKAGDIVELDMQNKAFMGNISRIEHIFNNTKGSSLSSSSVSSAASDSKAFHNGGLLHTDRTITEGTDFSRGIQECLDFDTSKGHASEDAAEKAISEQAGKDVGDKFHTLVTRRHDIISKLQLLCFEATMEKDAGKRKFMHDHVLEMAQIRSELDKHITNTASLFAVSQVD